MKCTRVVIKWGVKKLKVEWDTGWLGIWDMFGVNLDQTKAAHDMTAKLNKCR